MAEPNVTLTPELLLQAYANGWFPMAEARDGEELHWFSPDPRGILPLERFHVPRSFSKFLKHCPFTLTADRDFPAVIRACAETPRTHEDGTWINDTIIALYTELQRLGHAHSVECWEGNRLAGGLYGVSLGGAFFGESMFSRTENASKTALVGLVNILQSAGYTLLDTQYINPHLLQFGAETMPKEAYLDTLEQALTLSPSPSEHFSTAAAEILGKQS